MTFLENYKAIIAGQGANVSPLPVMWSVCVEEHFYLVWGLLLCFINIRHIPKVAIICTAVALISRSIFVILGYSRLDLLTNFDLFAIGAVPAYLLITRPAKFEAAINGIDKGMKGFYLVLVIATVQIMPFFRSPASEIFAPFLVAVLFTFLLSMFLPRGSTFGLGDDNWLSRLGKYTYALYLFHTVVINLLSRLSAAADLSLDRVDTAALFFALALGLCILASVVSYSLIERPFLQLKRLFY